MADETVMEVEAVPVAGEPESSEGQESWQQTDQEAAVAVTEAAIIEAAAEVSASAELTLEQEQTQTALLSQLTATFEQRINQLQESQTLALEAQTVEITSLRNTLSDLQTSLNPTIAGKPKRNVRRTPVQRAEERRKRSAEKKAARRKA